MQTFTETIAVPLQKRQAGEISATPPNEDAVNLRSTLYFQQH